MHDCKLQSDVSQMGHSQSLSIFILVGDLGHIAIVADVGTGKHASSPRAACTILVSTVVL